MAKRLEELANDALRPGVNLVKMLGDEVMLASVDAAGLVEVVLDLLDRRGQVVIAHLGKHTAKPPERPGMALQERLLGLDRRGDRERRPEKHERMKNTCTVVATPARHTCASPQSTSAVLAGAWTWGTNTSATDRPSSRRRRRTVIADRRLSHIDAILIDQPPHPPGRMTLLARRLTIGQQPLIGQIVNPRSDKVRPVQAVAVGPNPAVVPSPSSTPAAGTPHRVASGR